MNMASEGEGAGNEGMNMASEGEGAGNEGMNMASEGEDYAAAPVEGDESTGNTEPIETTGTADVEGDNTAPIEDVDAMTDGAMAARSWMAGGIVLAAAVVAVV